MKKVMNNVLFSLLGVFVFFGMIMGVSAGKRTLTYTEYERVTVDSLGPNFTTKIAATSVSNSPTVETKVGRKMFNIAWYDSGTASTTFITSGTETKSWSSNGTWGTRATWTNLTSGSSITATFTLY